MTSRIDHKHLSPSTLLSVAAALGCALSITACRGSEGDVQGVVDAIDKRSETLLMSDIRSINGTYGAECTNRTGAWSLEVEIGAPLDNDELSVVRNDVDCVLTLTEFVTDSETLAADPALVLDTTYEGSPSAFDDPALFYGNAKLSAVDFAADFVITILYSDDPALATDDNTAEFTVSESSVTATDVPAPSYTLNPDTLEIFTDIGQVVQSAIGNATLTAGAVLGQNYVVVEDIGLDTYEEVDAAYLGAGTPAAIAALVPASKFTLVGEDLDAGAVKRTLIIANTVSGVRSYQSFELTFLPAVVVP